MLKINYEFTALQPIHTGSDENTGTEKKLRREKVLLNNPVMFESNFENIEQKRESFLSILYHVWKCVDFESMQKTRLMTIWNEFTSKVLASSAVRTKEQFLNVICNKMGIRSLVNEYSINLTNEIDKFSDYEFLELVRNELQYLILRLKVKIQQEKESKLQAKESLSMFTVESKEVVKQESRVKAQFTKYFDYVPYISGNSIRGILRRLAMYDFCVNSEITSLDKSIYHQLFTGGNITDSTGKESLENRERFIAMCPMLGLFGSAIGNQTIEGELKVSGARPKCLEHETGDLSFWELTETKFQTRLDSSKTEKDISIVSESKEAPTSQMIYQYETFILGTKFNHGFALTTDDKLMISAFYHLLGLFKANNYICGSSARDNGLIDIKINIPDNANKLYLDYLESNRSDIQSFFKIKEITKLKLK